MVSIAPLPIVSWYVLVAIFDVLNKNCGLPPLGPSAKVLLEYAEFIRIRIRVWVGNSVYGSKFLPGRRVGIPIQRHALQKFALAIFPRPPVLTRSAIRSFNGQLLISAPWYSKSVFEPPILSSSANT